jgi:hypothetical protein
MGNRSQHKVFRKNLLFMNVILKNKNGTDKKTNLHELTSAVTAACGHLVRYINFKARPLPREPKLASALKTLPIRR